MNQELEKIILEIAEKKGASAIPKLSGEISLRRDLGFDSFDLAELTVLVEDAFGVDIFATGLVDTIAEIESKLNG